MQLQQDRPPYVRFEYRPRQNHALSQEEGRPKFDNVAYAIVMQYGSKDEFVKEAEEWISQKKREAANGGYNPEWVSKFEDAFKAFQKGHELPPDGTPTQMLPFLNPGEVAQLRAMNIHTLEDACEMNEGAMAAYGMGGRAIRDKCRAYRESAKDMGKIAERVAALEVANRDKDETIKQQSETIAQLKAMVPKNPKVG